MKSLSTFRVTNDECNSNKMELAVQTTLIFVVVTLVSPSSGEMCSAMVSDGGIEDLRTLQARTFAAFRSACREQQHIECRFNTTPSEPHTFRFFPRPVSMPFKVQFVVKVRADAMIALAEDMTQESIFAEISLGGWANTKSAIRSCYGLTCGALRVDHRENDLLSETDYRPFWIGYEGGVVTVGKGSHEESFLEWDAGAHHSRIPATVYIGTGTWQEVSGSWVFPTFCE